MKLEKKQLKSKELRVAVPEAASAAGANTPMPASPTCVSRATAESKIVDCSSDNEHSAPRTSRKRPRPGKTYPGTLSRLVSHESDMNQSPEATTATPCISSAGEEDDEESSSFASAVGNEQDMETEEEEDDEASSLPAVPPLPNSLNHAPLLSVHTRSLQLESELFPMRLILSRLMSNPTHNRRGLFNVPVDPVALGLFDYHRIVKKPMDLGTVKARLHAIAYTSRQDVAKDIRLVFHNAMLYNPHNNLVHICARELLAIFEDSYLDAQIKAGEVPIPVTLPTAESLANEKAHVLLRSEGPVPGTTDKETAIVADPAVRQVVASIVSVVQMASPPLAPPLPAGPLRGHHPKRKPLHSCATCQGRSCAMCHQGCLALEPALLICTGSNCGSAKIRKGAVYHITPDGSRQFCHKCYANLTAILPQEREHGDSSHDAPVRYKRDLLKRKNEEEVVEEWLTCSRCHSGVHRICAMHNEFVHDEEDYVCPSCVTASPSVESSKESLDVPTGVVPCNDEMYTFVSGSDSTVPMSEFLGDGAEAAANSLSADALTECAVSSFIQEKIRKRMVDSGIANADRTVTVRIISECDKSFGVPDIVRKHFRMPTDTSQSHFDATGAPPSVVGYKSKAIALFQKIDGLDVCIFCMYVQEYDGNDKYDEGDAADGVAQQQKRVYIAYLDSVEYFRPRPCRTEVYHEMLVSYLATARARGYETAHIWACPPARGNSFVFWNHPNSQRTPTKDRLVSWYHGALSKAAACGVVTDVRSLYESAFHEFMSKVKEDDLEATVSESFHSGSRPGRMLCPPLLDGDFWIEEAVRTHNASLARYLKSKSGAKETSCRGGAAALADHLQAERCPAIQVASILKHSIMAHPSAEPFIRPVNASAMGLKDYHRIILKPMDLGTVYSHAVLGEFDSLRELMADVELVFQNAMRYNPKGHPVHGLAKEMQALFLEKIGDLADSWSCGDQFPDDCSSWERFADMSMSLDVRLGPVPANTPDKVSQSPSKAKEGVVPDAAAPKASSPLPTSTEETIQVRATKVVKKLDLLTGGPDAVLQRMAGEDVWLLDKRNPIHPSKLGSAAKKKLNGKRKKIPEDPTDELVSNKRRRQSWLGEEVGIKMRRIRTSFFTCSLRRIATPSDLEQEKQKDYDAYIASFEKKQKQYGQQDSPIIKSRIADARHGLLEFSQYRNFEFDTLRRAKYSTAMLLYHLHNADGPGLVPSCTSCGVTMIQNVRWHKISKPVRLGKVPAERQELCSTCFSKVPKQNSKDFIPLPISYKL